MGDEMRDQLIANVEVRRHNGQCEYGEWLAIDDSGVPGWVGDLVADEIAEHDVDDGMVDQGGSMWVWRKGDGTMRETFEVAEKVEYCVFTPDEAGAKR